MKHTISKLSNSTEGGIAKQRSYSAVHRIITSEYCAVISFTCGFHFFTLTCQTMRIRSWISWVQGLWAFCCQVNFKKYWTCAKKIANGTSKRLSKNPIRRKKKGKTKEYAYQECKRKPRNKRFAGFLIMSNFLQSSGPRLPTVGFCRRSSVPSLCTSTRETQRECTPCHQDFRNKRSPVIISPKEKKKKKSGVREQYQQQPE
jgi:hypothetical protein